MVLSGINLYLAMTGQEEVQYKVFQKYGLSDADIRGWFNGPALLTWSRGQNEYGSGIAGPLPRSWMKQQWGMQKQILARTRSLGMSGQLPGFQGNVPVQFKTIHNDANITKQGDTGWMDSLDPLFGKIADDWMKELIADFGTDHWYQLDGYFNGGTAPWLDTDNETNTSAIDTLRPACTWSGLQNDTYLAGYPTVQKTFAYPAELDAAKALCEKTFDCGGLTSVGKDKVELRQSDSFEKSPYPEEFSFNIVNLESCRGPMPDLPSWRARGTAAYTGLNRTDPDAIWSFQGWAFVGWSSAKQAASLKSFVDITPTGKFNVIDMGTNGEGEWKKWNNASFWGANYVWTTLHDFGGTDGLKGDLSHINEIPFEADGIPNNNLWGTGFTPEGIDQNPVYYEVMLDANWRDQPIANMAEHIVARSHRRYQLNKPSKAVTDAWTLLVNSSYAQDLSVQDGTGVPHLGSAERWAFLTDRYTPSDRMCQIFTAWSKLIDVASSISSDLEPFRYDLVNTGREVLAQLAGPTGQNFTSALGVNKPSAAAITDTGNKYAEVLNDIDRLVATDQAFLLGSWIKMAKGFAGSATDCTDTGYPTITTCEKFYEWNARVQLTTWNPTPKGASKIPGGPIDYASKHWSGLISDYYAKRVTLRMELGAKDAASGIVTPQAAVDRLFAEHAYTWTTATNPFPTEPVGDAVAISRELHQKYASKFASCPTDRV